MQDELHASTASCCCEIAVAKATNRYWGGHVWDARDHHKYKHLADVGENIEVRRIRSESNPFAVRRRDVDAGRWVYAAYACPPVYRDVLVYGFIRAEEAWVLGTRAAYDPDNTRVVTVDCLRPIGE
jgi:hypothetical protein